MPAIPCTVRVNCVSLQQRYHYLSWLLPDHELAIKAAGASAFRVVVPDRINDSETAMGESQFTFVSRQSFEAYLCYHATALRLDDLRHSPPGSGLSSVRQVAEVAAEF